MSPSQQNKVAAYRWVVELIEQARKKGRLSVAIERYVVRLEYELQGRAEKIENYAEQAGARRQRMRAALSQLDDEEPE